MLKSQKISLRMSEIRESLNSQADDAPVEDREKLLNEYKDSERNYRAEVPNVAGFVGTAPALTAPTDPTISEILSFSQVIAAATSVIDGKYAMNLTESRLLVNPSAYQAAAAAYQGTNGDVPVTDYLIARSAGFRVSANLPADAANVSPAVAFATGGAGSAVAPMWEGIQLLRDPPPGLAFGNTDGTAAREAMRCWFHTSIAPVGQLVQAELREKLEEPGLTLTFPALSTFASGHRGQSANRGASWCKRA